MLKERIVAHYAVFKLGTLYFNLALNSNPQAHISASFFAQSVSLQIRADFRLFNLNFWA
jgi:hypothetical protein